MDLGSPWALVHNSIKKTTGGVNGVADLDSFDHY